MDRRQFLKGVVATGAATIAAATLSGTPARAAAGYGTPANGAAGSGSRGARSAERFLLGTARRALA